MTDNLDFENSYMNMNSGQIINDADFINKVNNLIDRTREFARIVSGSAILSTKEYNIFLPNISKAAWPLVSNKSEDYECIIGLLEDGRLVDINCPLGVNSKYQSPSYLCDARLSYVSEIVREKAIIDFGLSLFDLCENLIILANNLNTPEDKIVVYKSNFSNIYNNMQFIPTI